MGVTGAQQSVHDGLPLLLSRIQSFLPTPVPLAVGFGVSTQDHFQKVGSLTDGVVVGSKLVTALKEASPGKEAETVQRICASISGGPTRPVRAIAPVPADDVVSKPQPPIATNEPTKENPKQLPHRFGEYGGQYVPEALFDCLIELEKIYSDAVNDPAFWAEFKGLYGYMNRPSGLYKAERLSEMAGGANIWFKREDLNHTGSHKINNAIGQVRLTTPCCFRSKETYLMDRFFWLKGSVKRELSPRQVLVVSFVTPRVFRFRADPEAQSMVSLLLRYARVSDLSAASTWEPKMSVVKRSTSSVSRCSVPRCGFSRLLLCSD